MEFLLYLLKTTDIDGIASSLYILDGNVDTKPEKTNDEIHQEINQEPDIINSDNTTTYATPKNGNTIPNI